MTYKLTVIVPTYNAENYILEAVNSIKEQSLGFENIELILVDDNSNDNTKSILNELSEKYENIKSIFLEGNSCTASQPRNVGIENATSEYIMFLDNDDIYYPTMCEEMHKTINDNDIDVVSCRYDINTKIPNSFLDDFNPEKYEFKGKYDKEKDIIHLDSIEDFPNIMTLGHPTMIWTKIFRKSMILENSINFPKGDLYEDVYFCTASYLKAKGIIILNGFLGYGYQLRTEGEDKSTCQIFSKSMLQKQLRGFLKIMDLLKSETKYDTLKSELIIDMTKIYMYADIEKDCQNKFLNIMKPYYKDYKIGTRVNTASFAFNLVINIFIKIFSLNNSLAIFIKNLFLRIKNR
ncbi:glycosyltransferase family 2 protein [uncultured Methanobrevibacter sp.]|uniref:glycosyltransferase family 2 protein n=1 Tax=uncultured Methanobrevibacter sp. TaxID=253161 RepID=UPI0025CDD696|nr:glycosyltransferase family 2 protein [uncultured Methanobrevibacter sp.]